ncbi:prepilin-type N-terminal cleavage/methylation domain-containing protein [Pseudomonas aeruginosa]|nr:prepilin-type N-terminal cleavage/methylation domain-containing protein [Pseudomonas aeruginosa]
MKAQKGFTLIELMIA